MNTYVISRTMDNYISNQNGKGSISTHHQNSYR